METIPEQEPTITGTDPQAPPKPAGLTAEEKRRRKRRRALKSFLFRVIGLVLVVYILFFHLVGVTLMPNTDMAPRLDAGDLLLFYRLERNPKARDIVVIDKIMDPLYVRSGEDPGIIRKALNWLGFPDPNGSETKRFVCRVVAGPGDTVDIGEESGLKINGNTVAETNIFYQTRPYEEHTEYPLKLGEGEYFVLADMRNGGMDSRYFGTVTLDEIKGVVITLLRRNNM